MKKIMFMVVALCLPVFASIGQKAAKELVSYKKTGSAMPDIRIVTESGTQYTQANLKSQHGSMLIMFNPTCEHCIDMAKAICGNHEKFQQVPIAFMAGSNLMSYMDHFFQETKLHDCSDIMVGVDSAEAAYKMYLFQSLPQINIYDSDQKLVKIFSGDVPIDSLTYYLKL